MKILYAEDERQLSMAVTEILKMEGYEVDAVHDGAKAWERLQTGCYDAAILDIMMPEMSGTQVLALMRSRKIYIPVLMLTAKSTTDDRIEGLSAGADDYLGKPFAMKELIARLHAVIRRNVKYRDFLLQFSNITLDRSSNELKSDRGSLRLSSKESELLALFMKQGDYAFTVDELSKLLWDGEQDDSAVTLYLSYLKNKLEQIHAAVNIYRNENGYFLGKGTAYEKS